MNTFDLRNIQCPYCKKTKLWVIEDNGQIIAYKCTKCNSLFDINHKIYIDQEKVTYFLKRRNPDYLEKLDSEDLYENLKKTEELGRTGIPFFTNTYKIGSKKFDEN